MNSLQARLAHAFAQMLDVLVKRIPDLLAALVVLLLFVLFAFLARRALRAALGRVHLDQNVAALITRLAYYLILAIGFIEALSLLNVNLAALGVGVGVLGFAVGFAMKDILSNSLSGLLILWTRHFTVGDQIKIRDYEGTVEAIEMRGTILRTYDGRRVTIPNSEVYTNPVVNNTTYSLRRSSIFVSVGYETDFAQAEQVIRTALLGVSGVAENPAPDVLIKELGAYAIQMEIRIWTAAQQLEMLTLDSAATKAIKLALDEAGIRMPIPAQSVRLQGSESDERPRSSAQ